MMKFNNLGSFKIVIKVSFLILILAITGLYPSKIKTTIPLVDLESPITDAIRWSQHVFAPFLDFVSQLIGKINGVIYNIMSYLPVYGVRFSSNVVLEVAILPIALALLIWLVSEFRYAVFTFFAFQIFLFLGYWEPTLRSLSLVFTATSLSIAIGFPIGVMMARSDRFETVMKPVLDFMQSFPPYIYLVPAVIFFGLGAAPAVIATILFAVPPPAKLTNLGLREVPVELIEAGKSFGCNSFQLLYKVEFPEALPSILVGINQCIMMSLGMVVIAALIGAGGLGAQVIIGIQRLWIGKGVLSGLLVVLLAMWLDRVTQSFRKRQERR